MGGERYLPKPRLAGRLQRDIQQVLVVEVSVRHGHRFPSGGTHGKQGRCVVSGGQQTDFAADQLGVAAGSAQTAEERQLFVHCPHGVATVDPHFVRVH